MAEDNALLAIVKEARRNGKDYIEIERLFDIPAPRAEAMMKEYYSNKAASIDPTEYRMLQLERLEGLIDVMYQMALLGNIKSAEVLLKNLEQINVLLGLNLEQTKIEIKIVTEQQSEVVYQIVSRVLGDMLGHVQSNLTDQKALAAVEDSWEEKVDQSYARHVEEIIEAELVS